MAKIILIDDEIDILQLLEITLESVNHKVDTCISGKQALLKMREISYDVAITDMVMPDQDGIETIKQIKDLDPGIKIIGMSGGGIINADTYLKLAQHLGADIVLQKPFEGQKLIDAVHKLMS
ncbi:response regulator [bacterium]|nr:response regulator [bacterium]